MDLNLFEYYYIFSQIDDYDQEQKRKKSEEFYRSYPKYAPEYVPETIQDPTQKLTFEELPGIFRTILCLLYVIYKAFAFVITAVGGILSLLFIVMILQWLLF